VDEKLILKKYKTKKNNTYFYCIFMSSSIGQ
jgi:hypothetical protein